jgi:two-component sensor histidine kinase/HAMP domain-containing protein
MKKETRLINSLYFRLILIFSICTMVPLILVSTNIGLLGFKLLEKQSLELQQKVSIAIGNEIRTFIEKQVDELVFLDKMYELGTLELRKQQEILSALLLQQRDYQEFTLLNSDGQERIRLSRTHVILKDELRSRAGFEEFMYPISHHSNYFSHVRFDETIREPLLTISIPLFDQRSGDVVSVLVADMRFMKIWKLLTDIELPGEGMAYVIDQAGQIIAHKNPTIVLRGTSIELPEQDGRSKDLSEKNTLIARDIVQFGDQKLIIIAEQTLSYALKPATEILQISVIITFIAFVFSVSLTMITTRYIVKPIKALAIAAQSVTNGNYSSKVEESKMKASRLDEVGQLAFDFNKMVDHLSNSRNIVEQYTVELESTNKQLNHSITMRKQAEQNIKKDLEEKKILLRELYHRTKNNMQVISSMLLIQSRNSDNEYVKDSFKETVNKIDAMALVHQKLYQSKDLSQINLSEYIEESLKLMMESYGKRSEKITLELELEDIFILIDSAIPLGLVLNELISNIIKYAFPNFRKGQISLRLYKNKDGTINIHLEDNGVGVPVDFDPRSTNTIGLETIFALVEYQLNGKLTYKIDNGLKWHIQVKDNKYKRRV